MPGWYAELEGATTDNIAWRNLGAALVAVNGVGLLAAGSEAERRLYDVVMLASVLEAIALMTHLGLGIHGHGSDLLTGPLALAALVSVALVVVRPRQA